MLKKIYRLSDEGSRAITKAGLSMSLFNLASLLPAVLLAAIADEMLRRHFGVAQGGIPLWGYWGASLAILAVIFLAYK